MELRTEIEIHAPAAIVWRVLTDTAEYPKWNPLIAGISGDLNAGSQIEVAFYKGDGSHRLLRPVVQQVEPGRYLSWKGHLWIPGLYHGEHGFEIRPSPRGGIHFIHRAMFGGLLLPVLRHKLRAVTLPGFRAMNRMVKDRAETMAMA
ncbi:MAG: SRPBCC domain-containing protein [Alphaproteobacteria bacterium CG_4_10_14_0_2_um_filter_63_37]|nr:MAG: hypothetical protein AUJ55_04245 [Proteobacteria bacterium CG1_02_64_396]PJA24155.1 MAG: SRPBCC domain-containing protein [Alphaproteobacteria bacterium CG_4_10_14_0_2_um_filter_63_37]